MVRDPVRELTDYAKGLRREKPDVPIILNLGFIAGQGWGVLMHTVNSVPGVKTFCDGFEIGKAKVEIDYIRRAKQIETEAELDAVHGEREVVEEVEVNPRRSSSSKKRDTVIPGMGKVRMVRA